MGRPLVLYGKVQLSNHMPLLLLDKIDSAGVCWSPLNAAVRQHLAMLERTHICICQWSSHEATLCGESSVCTVKRCLDVILARNRSHGWVNAATRVIAELAGIQVQLSTQVQMTCLT